MQRLAERIGRSLEHAGRITRDVENAYLALDPDEEPAIHGLLGASITYRIATGPRAGPVGLHAADATARAGHAAAGASPRDRGSLCTPAWPRNPGKTTNSSAWRAAPRGPPVATERLALTGSGHARYTLRTPYRDDTAHVILNPEDFNARLAALVPRPCAHLTRYHRVFAPASPDRARIAPRTRAAAANERGEAAATDRQRALTWAKRLKRVFAIDVDKSAGLPICRAEGRRDQSRANIRPPIRPIRSTEVLTQSAAMLMFRFAACRQVL